MLITLTKVVFYKECKIRGLSLNSRCVLRFSIIKKFGKWSVNFSINFPLVQCVSLKLTKVLSTGESLLYSTNLVFPKNFGVRLFFYNQSIFDPRPENYLSFSKKSPTKIV